MSSEWELYVAAKSLTNFNHLKGASTFLLILKKKSAYLYNLKGNWVALDDLGSNLQITILRFRT